MNRSRRLHLAALTALGLAIGAADIAPVATAAPANSKSCFWARSVTGFRSVDNRSVYLSVNVRDVYELKLFAPCLDVAWSQSIALRSRGSSWICEGTGNFAEILTRSSAGGQRCQVASVRKLTPEDVNALPRGARP